MKWKDEYDNIYEVTLKERIYIFLFGGTCFKTNKFAPKEVTWKIEFKTPFPENEIRYALEPIVKLLGKRAVKIKVENEI